LQPFQNVWELLTTNNRLFFSLIKGELSKLGITLPQIFVLDEIKDGPKTIGEISRAVELSNSTVSGIVDRLERDKFVRRQRDQSDRRVVWVFLAEEAIEMLSKTIPFLKADYQRHLFADLNSEDIQRLEESLNLLNTSLLKKIQEIQGSA
jgi:DNA-binding MarR family transcriptional regulator